MRTCSTVFSLLLTVALPAHAGTPDEVNSTIFADGDWQLVCDNALTCQLAGYTDDREDGTTASVKVVRHAGRHQPIRAFLRLGNGNPAQLSGTPQRFSLNGADVGELRFSTDEHTAELNPDQVAQLHAALLTSANLVWSTADQQWSISDRGRREALLHMDEFQGRQGTPGAIIDKGGRPESEVYPSLRIPLIGAARLASDYSTPLDLPTEEKRAIISALKSASADEPCASLAASTVDGAQPEIRPLSADKLLVSHACTNTGAGANPGKGYWVIKRSAPYSPVQISTSATDTGYGMIIESRDLRAEGDCTRRRVWVWDGRSFRLGNATEPTLCRHIAPGGGWRLFSYFSGLLAPH